MPTPSVASLQQQRKQLSEQLAASGELRPGSLVERYRRCGKSSCHCAKKGSRGHGPQFSVTHSVQGKTVTRIIPRGPAVERTRQQIAEYRRFRKLVSEFVTLSEQICDAQLEQARRAAPDEGKKKRPRRRTGPRGRSRH